MNDQVVKDEVNKINLTTSPIGRIRTRKKKGVNPYIPITLFFIVWELVSRLNGLVEVMNPNFLPGPVTIMMRMIEMAKTGIILESLLSSTLRISIGFVIGCVLAVAVSIIMSRYIQIEHWISPVLSMVGPIPALALLPLFIIWFGIGEVPKILLIAWTVFIPVHVYTLDGLKSVNPILIRSALSLGASQWQILKKVILPSALPSILVGAQVSLGLAFSALVVSEMMGAKSGLGYLIVDARNYFKMSDMFVAIVLIGLEYMLFSVLLKYLENKLASWRKGGVQNAVESH